MDSWNLAPFFIITFAKRFNDSRTKNLFMTNIGTRPEGATLAYLGLKHVSTAYWNMTPAELVEETILLSQGTLTNTGALAIDTGEFTGRSPIRCFNRKQRLVEPVQHSIRFR